MYHRREYNCNNSFLITLDVKVGIDEEPLFTLSVSDKATVTGFGIPVDLVIELILTLGYMLWWIVCTGGTDH